MLKLFLEILQNSQENTCEFYGIFKSTYFYRTPPVAASGKDSLVCLLLKIVALELCI